MTALEQGQQWLSQFRLLEELASGNDQRPRVWLAEKHGSSAKVVLKFLRPGAPTPFLVRRLADWRATRVNGFMPLLGVHTEGDQMALELPYIPNESVSLRATSYTRWSVWLEHVIEIIGELHQENVIHGDIMLANIRRDERHKPVVSDLWLPGDGKSPYSASPQRLNGEPISVKDDLFAIGALMHELITGYPPRYPGAPEVTDFAKFDVPKEVTAMMNALLSLMASQRPSLEQLCKVLAPLNTTRPHEDEFSTPPPVLRPVAVAAAALVPPHPQPRAASIKAVLASVPPLPPAPDETMPRAAMPIARPVIVASAADLVTHKRAERDLPLEVKQWVQPNHAAEPILLLEPQTVLPIQLGDGVQLASVEVGSPTWKREPVPLAPTAGGPSPFPSRTRLWFLPGVAVLIIAATAAYHWAPPDIKQNIRDQLNEVMARLQPPAPTDVPPLAVPSTTRPSAAATATEKIESDGIDPPTSVASARNRNDDWMQTLTKEAADDERAERWAEAREAYQEILSVDNARPFAHEGVGRSDMRMKLDAQLSNYIDNPDLLATDEVRRGADSALAVALNLENRGPRVASQISQLGALLSQLAAPVTVALASDGLTDINIDGVGRLGMFSQRSMSLKPGRYRVVGSRLGYRNVQRELSVGAGQANASLDIRCEDQI